MFISILTSTYNSEKFLKDAFNSYFNQKHVNKELVVIDGGSADQTLKIVNHYQKDIAKFISEPDQGIYDALNKGIKLAKGDIIGILHSDDFFADDEVLADVSKIFLDNSQIQAVYGDLNYVDRDDPNKIIRQWISGKYQYDKLKYGWMPPHPALFIKKECFNKYGHYKLNYSSAADYDLILRFLYKYKIKAAYLPRVLVKMRVGGLSNYSIKNRIVANLEDRLALKTNGIKFPLIVSIIKPLRKLGQYFK